MSELGTRNIGEKEQRKREKVRKKLREEYQKKFPMVSQEYSIRCKIKNAEDEMEEIEAKYGKKGVGKLMNGISIGMFGIFMILCLLLAKSFPGVWLFIIFSFIFGGSALWSVLLFRKCVQVDKRRELLSEQIEEGHQKLEAISHVITFEEWLEIRGK